MRGWRWPLVLCAALALAGCKREDAGRQAPGEPASTLPGVAPVPWTDNSERTWAGLLPCSDCVGVDTRLVLRTENGRRHYLLTETYLGSAGKNSFSRAGTWNEELQAGANGQPETVYVLDPEQDGQRYSLKDDGALELLDGNGKPSLQSVAYRLQRL